MAVILVRRTGIRFSFKIVPLLILLIASMSLFSACCRCVPGGVSRGQAKPPLVQFMFLFDFLQCLFGLLPELVASQLCPQLPGFRRNVRNTQVREVVLMHGLRSSEHGQDGGCKHAKIPRPRDSSRHFYETQAGNQPGGD